MTAKQTKRILALFLSLLLLFSLLLFGACGKKEPLSGITFKSATFTADNTEKFIYIEGELPEGVTVSYEGNGKTDPGSYVVIAHFSDSTGKYKLPDDLRATLTITKPEKEIPRTGSWATATYVRDTALGTGGKTLLIDVKADGVFVTFTVNTDADTVGAALLAIGLISGENGPYGLYIKEVNGMTADYATDGTYWAFYQNGAYMTTGADSASFDDGAHYEFVRE